MTDILRTVAYAVLAVQVAAAVGMTIYSVLATVFRVEPTPTPRPRPVAVEDPIEFIKSTAFYTDGADTGR